MTYRTSIRPRARRDLSSLLRNLQRVIAKRIDALADDPRPAWTKLLARDLKGRRGFRVGDYRVVYQVNDDERGVRVLDIGPRSRVYQGAEQRT